MESRLLVFALSFIVVLSLTPLAIRLAGRLNFLDYPQGHKSHNRPMPLLGGLVIFVGLTSGLGLGLIMGWLAMSKALVGFYLACTSILLLGLLDDKMGLSPSWKFSGQLATAFLFLAFYNPGLSGFGFPLGFLVLLFWTVGLINALNFLNNIDGLCSGIGLVASLAFALLSYLEGKTLLLVIGLSLAGGFLAFLKYNLTPAKIFLGDAGSMLSGFALAGMGMLFVSEIRTQYSLLVPLLILSYPIFDISFVTFTRLKQGRKFYQGGLDHSSHRLVYLGVTSQKAVRGILIISFFLAATGILTFYFFDSPVKILIPLALTFALTLFGIHLHRNFLNFKEKLFLIGLDVVVVNVAFWLVWQVHGELGQNWLGLTGLRLDASALAILLNFYWINLFAVAGLYEFYRGILVKEELKAVLKTVLGGGAILVAMGGWHLWGSSESTLLFLVYVLLILAALASLRSLVILAQRWLCKTGKLSDPAVIVGTEQNAQLAWEQVTGQRRQGLKVLGFIDENHSQLEQNLPFRILGKLENLEETLRKNKVREVLIAVEPDWPGSVSEVLETAQNLEVNFRIKSNLLERVRGRKRAPLFDNSFYKVYPSQMRTWEWGAKRIMDIILSFTLLTLTIPIQIGLVLGTYIWKRKNPFERVTILGKRGKPVKLIQFESKYSFGIWRKLPILLSVFKGDLSLIGPGWGEVEKVEDPFLLYSLFEDQLKVKPGLINPTLAKRPPSDGNGAGPRIEPADMQYIECMSFTSDLRVLLKSFSRPLSKLLF